MKEARFARCAWGVLGITILVILWGSWVRISGSGAGCGEQWPLCRDSIVPSTESSETFIEFFHRATSGIAFLLALGIFFWSRRIFSKGHLARTAAAWAMFFMFVEALVGACLVLFSLVGTDASLARTLLIGAHLINSFLLLASLALAAIWARIESPSFSFNENKNIAHCTGGIIALLLVAATGGIAALANTLFPETSLFVGLVNDFSPAAHILVRLRIGHPLAAVLLGLYFVWLGVSLYASSETKKLRRLSASLVTMLVLQLIVGCLTLLLSSPLYLQIFHLSLAILIWLTLVSLVVSLSSAPKL